MEPMFPIDDLLFIPEDEIQFTFARSGGPGGQNVNKVASKAILRWNLSASKSIPEWIRQRLRTLQRRRISGTDELVIQSQEHRDQERNKQACLEKLREIVKQAATLPKPRRATRPTRGSKERRLRNKKHRAAVKSSRKRLKEE